MLTHLTKYTLLNVVLSVFGGQYYMSLHHVHVKVLHTSNTHINCQYPVNVQVWKKNHPTAVMFATFFIGSFLIYQVMELSLIKIKRTL